MSAPPIPARPEPVLDAAKIAGNIAGLVGSLAALDATLAAFTHWSWAIATAATLGAVTAGLAKVLPLITAQGARAQVTPLSNPVDMAGAPLKAAAIPAASGLMQTVESTAASTGPATA